MDKFYIDRQFGQPIWIDVEKGVVQNCYGESEKYNAKMNENYKGKSITFLKEDFIGRAMAGTYHNLRPEAIVSHLQIIDAYKSKIRNISGQIYNITGSSISKKSAADEIKKLHDQRAELEVLQSAAEKELMKEHIRIQKEHNYYSSMICFSQKD